MSIVKSGPNSVCNIATELNGIIDYGMRRQ